MDPKFLNPSTEEDQVKVERQAGLSVRKLLGLAMGLVAVAGLGWAYRTEVRAGMNGAIDLLRAAGPWVFFGAMAVLPAVGFPLLPFTLVAGPAFAPTLGVGNVAVVAVVAVAVNVLLSYGLATWVFRRWMQRLVGWLGYRLPVLPPGSAWQVAFLVRLAPGLPFWVQSYALGIMRLPLLPYTVASVTVPACYLVGTILGGAALWQGNMKHALTVFAAVGVVGAVVQLWRRFGGASGGKKNM